MLMMNGRTILNVRDFREHFHLPDALRQHRAFAAFAVRSLARMDDCLRAMSMLFALCSMQIDGRIDQLDSAVIPHLRVSYQELRALLDKPLPTPEAACAHVRSLVSCFAQESQTIQLVPMRTARAAAAFAASCEATDARKKALFLMIVSACRLAGVMWERVTITPEQAVNALLGVEAEIVEKWTRMPATGDLLLEEREEPWRLLIHPAWRSEALIRTLPAAEQLDVARIGALSHAHGSMQHSAKVQFYLDKADDAPYAEVSLRAGEYVTLTVLRDGKGNCMPLPPRPDSVENGRDLLVRPKRASDALQLNGKPVTLPEGRLTGFAPDGSGGFVALVDGRLEASAFTRRAFLLDFLLDVQGERFIDVAVRDFELTLLCPDGHVLSSYDYLRTDRPVLTLDDYFAS